MHKKKYFLWFFIPLLFCITAFFVMLLWNALLPELFPVKEITYWQALGLLVLCRVLSGNIGGNFFRPPFRQYSQHKRENWMNLSEEEKRKVKEEWKKRWGES